MGFFPLPFCSLHWKSLQMPFAKLASISRDFGILSCQQKKRCNMKHVVDADAGDMVTVSIYYIQPMHAQCAVQNQDVLDEQPKKPQQL